MRNNVFILIVFVLSLTGYSSFSQVGINTDAPNTRAVLDLNSPTNDQGLLVPRLSTLQRTANAFTSRLTESENGLLVFDTNDKLFYFWMHPVWKAVEAGVSGTIWRSGSDIPQNSVGEEGDFFLNVVDGSIYTKSSGQYILTANLKGLQGPQGPAGSQGSQGLNGEPGAPGPVGPQGPVGAQGAAGPVGPQGEVGPAGPPGPQGPQGIKGDTGETGPVGPEGSQGPIGPVGAVGAIGPQGLQGEPGIQGEIGPQGPQGLVGPEGPEGPKGDQGEPGPVGPAGPQGEKGDIGAQGPIGPQGLQGIQGVPGVSTSFNARTTTTNYTATGADDVIIALRGNTSITLPSAGSVPGKVFHIRHNTGLLDLAAVIIRAPAGNSIIDGEPAATFSIGGLLGITAISIIAVDADTWYIIGKF